MGRCVSDEAPASREVQCGRRRRIVAERASGRCEDRRALVASHQALEAAMLLTGRTTSVHAGAQREISLANQGPGQGGLHPSALPPPSPRRRGDESRKRTDKINHASCRPLTEREGSLVRGGLWFNMGYGGWGVLIHLTLSPSVHREPGLPRMGRRGTPGSNGEDYRRALVSGSHGIRCSPSSAVAPFLTTE